MDNNNWRPAPGGGSGGEPTMDAGDWRSQLQPDSRQSIVNNIMDTLKRHLPFSGQEGLQELKKIALRFEEKIYTSATSQPDYLRKISLKLLTMETKPNQTKRKRASSPNHLLTMETKSQNTMANSLPSNSGSSSKNPPDTGSLGNQGQSLPNPMVDKISHLMDNNNRRPAPGGGGGEPMMDAGDWRSQLQPDLRQGIVNKIMDTLKRHLPFSGQEGLQELKKIAVRFEEKIYTSATSQPDYLRKISLKLLTMETKPNQTKRKRASSPNHLLTMETKSQNTMANSLPSNSGSSSKNPPDTGNSGGS